jgi:hypothetical protein
MPPGLDHTTNSVTSHDFGDNCLGRLPGQIGMDGSIL